MLKEPTSEYESEARHQGERLGRMLCEVVGGSSSAHVSIGIAQGLLTSHRTLQQQGISTLLRALVAYAAEAKECDFTDMRNEAIVNNLTKHKAILADCALVPFI